MRTFVRRQVACTWILVTLGAVAVATAQTAPGAAENDRENRGVANVPVGASGLQVAIDPATGKLRPPTPAETRALAGALGLMLEDSSDGLEEVVWPDGTAVVDLQGRFMSVAVATVADDGTLAMECVDDPGRADALMAGALVAPAAPAPLEER